MLAIDKIVDHAALNRPRPVQRIQSAQIFNARRLVLAQDIAHAGRFKLEHATSEALGENLIRCGVVERQALGVEFDAVIFFDQSHGLLDDVERSQPEKIHLEKRQLLQPHHVVLRDNFVFACFAERDQFPQRNR